MTFWKVVFWLLAFITAKGAVGLLLSGNAAALDLLSLAVGAFSLIPYYGYAYQVAIGWKLFWQIGFVVVCIVYAFLVIPAGKESIDRMLTNPEIVSFVLFCLSIAIGMLMLIPPFKYAYKSNNIWVNHA